MSAADPITPERRRFSLRLPRPRWIGAVTVALVLVGAVAATPADEEIPENAPLPRPQVKVADSNVYRWVFGDGSDRVTARKQLDTLLEQKVRAVDLICQLTENQKLQLQLAGQGDAKRLIGRVEDIERRFQRDKDDPDEVKALIGEARLLKLGIIEPGLSNGRLLFVKILEQSLTADQRASYEPLRLVFRVGGVIQARKREAGDFLRIFLSDTAFADDGLANLKGLTNIESLALDGTQVTDAGLTHLKGLTALHTLVLTRTRVTDAGLAHLKELNTRLQAIWLDSTQVSDTGLVHLKGLTGLNALVLASTQVTDAGLAHLKGLTKLKQLSVDNTQVTDAGLVHLKGLTSLSKLYLANTRVTDVGLTHLKELTSLEWLDLDNTDVTDAGVAELKSALPELTINR